MAPSMPFYADYLWGRVKEENDVESVHLANWPEVQAVTQDLMIDMAATREIVTKSLEARTSAGIKVRQPVASVTGPLISTEMQKIVLDEVNAKSYVIADDQVSIDTNITPELKMEGDSRDFIRAVQEMRKAKGLSPNDRISLLVKASEGGEQVIKTFETEIKRVVGADTIEFGEANGEEIKAGDHLFAVEVK